MGFFKSLMGGGATNITPQQARQMMDQAGDYVLLDVRTPAEFKQVRIRGARLIPVDEILSRALAELPDKNVPIFVYCQSGARARSAARTLVQMGYTKVYNFGGIAGWPYETVRG